MKEFKQSVCQCRQKLAWEQPYPVTNQVGRSSVKAGANLLNSITEDIRGFSLAPLYSSEQLRRISQLHRRKDRHNQEDLNSNRRTSRNKPESNRIVLKEAASSEEG